MNSAIFNKRPLTPQGDKSPYVSQARLRPLVIAHRGDTKAGLENTLPAVAAALTLGIDGIEVDLRITRDGQVVLFHDDDLKRLADRPETIESLSLSEVRKIRLKGGHQIPSLEEFLDLAQNANLLNLELKTADPFSGALERKTLETLNRFPKNPALLISSFQPLSLWRIRRLAPHLPTGYLFEKHWLIHRIILPFLRPSSLNPPLRYLNRRLVDRQRRAGRRVFVWTVNDENDMKECMSLGVNGIITDEPRRLLDVINRADH